MSNLDTSYLFYRLAFIEANSGNGLVLQVSLSIYKVFTEELLRPIG